MAKKKKSQAERAEKAARSKEMNNKNQASGKKTQKNLSKQEPLNIPVRVITSISFLVSFVLLLIIFCFPEGGKLTLLVYNFICGLIGKVGYAVLIPALLYL